MARATRWIMGALGGAILLFAVGPRPRVRLDGKAPPVPQDPAKVADYLAEREGAVASLRPGTEARVVWAGAPGTKTRLSFVYLHGFSASRRETAPLAENLARRYAANLFEARLTGHGASGEALGAATAEDWIRDTREALALGRVLGDRTVVIGSSTGATLALLVGAEDQQEVAAYILLSPNFGPRDASAGLLLWPWARHWIPLIIGNERSWTPENPEHGQFWTTRYPVEALFSMMGLVEAARVSDLSRLTAPILIMHSDEDPVVDPESIEEAFIRMTGAEPRRREVVQGPGDHHVIAGDILARERTSVIEERVKVFLQSADISPPGA